MDTITRFSLLFIVLGLTGLYFISNLEPEFVKISEIDKTYLNKIVSTSGKVRNLYISNSSTLFLVLEENGKKIDVVMFRASNINLGKGDYVLVKGEVCLYKNKLEIIAREIKKL